MNILVTGGTGHLGRTVVARLKEADHHVRVLARRPGSDTSVEWIRGDLATGEGVVTAVDRVDAVLMERLARVRWPNELPGAGWTYGVPLAVVRDLVDYWLSGFDWRAHEARLNAHPQFLTTIDGQQVHFIHVRSPEPEALPLICTHGWPMSVFEYIDLIGPLTDPGAHGGDAADAFDVVIPSLPGHAFSGPTTEAGWDTRRIANAWVELMDALGYGRFGAHGNDAGSIVSPDWGHCTRPRRRRARNPAVLLPIRRSRGVRRHDRRGTWSR